MQADSLKHKEKNGPSNTRKSQRDLQMTFHQKIWRLEGSGMIYQSPERKKKHQPRILHLAIMSLKNEGEIQPFQ